MNLKTLLFVSAITTPCMMAVMMFQGSTLKMDGISPRGIINLELAKTPETASQIVDAWSPTVLQAAVTNTYIDFIFILCYGTLLYTLCLTTASWYTGFWNTAGKWLSIAMIVAAFFDVVENILLFKTMNGGAGREMIASTYMFAATKFLLVAVGIMYVLLSLVGKLLNLDKVAINNLHRQ